MFTECFSVCRFMVTSATSAVTSIAVYPRRITAVLPGTLPPITQLQCCDMHTYAHSTTLGAIEQEFRTWFLAEPVSVAVLCLVVVGRVKSAGRSRRS